MKKLLVILCISTSVVALAQNTPTTSTNTYSYPRTNQSPNSGSKLRINAYTLYAFDDKVDSYYDPSAYYDGKIKGGFEWGFGLEYLLQPKYGVELTYLRLDSKAPMTYFNNGIKFAEFDLGSNYILLGGNHYFKPNQKVEPYAGLQIGLGIFNIKNPENNRSTSATKFAWGFKAGTNIWFTDRIGLKLQGGLITAVQSAGGGLYFGTGGVGAGLASYSSIYQWHLGGGLTFKFGGAN